MENQKEEYDYYPPFNHEAARWSWIAKNIEQWMLKHRRNDFNASYDESKVINRDTNPPSKNES